MVGVYYEDILGWSNPTHLIETCGLSPCLWLPLGNYVCVKEAQLEVIKHFPRSSSLVGLPCAILCTLHYRPDTPDQ